MKLLAILLFFTLLQECLSIKIMVFSPLFGKSHAMFMGKLADFYVKAGHDVVMFQPIIVDTDPDLKLTGTKLARVIQRPRDFNETIDTVKFQARPWELNNKSFIHALRGMAEFGTAFGAACRNTLSDSSMMEQLRDEHFDIAIGQYGDQCFFGVVRKLEIERYIVALSSPLPSFIVRQMGLPIPTSFVPDFYRTPPIKMSMVERAINLFGALGSEAIFGWWLVQETLAAIREHYPDYQTSVALNKAAYVFVNTDEFVEFPQINIGGFGQEVVEPLNNEFKQILSESKRGAIIVSFGTIARSFTMQPELKKAFLEAFAQFKDVTFIWKYERDEDEVAKDYPNVRTFKWLPQAALLNHPKLIGFITHGGMNSIAESVTFGVPMISIALFADQTRNAQMLKERGIGLALDKMNLTKESIVEALNTLINDKNYHLKAKEIAEMINNKPETADQRVLKYTEFAAHYDLAAQLHMHGADLSIIQYYNLDVIFVLFLIIAFILLIFVVVLKILCSCFLKKKEKKNKKE